MLERLLPHIIHAAMTAAVIVLSVDILRKVDHMHKEKMLKEKHGLLKFLKEKQEEKK